MIHLMDAGRVIENEIAQGSVQREVAKTYALALRSDSTTQEDWVLANESILKRWSPAGLLRIKDAAWSGKWRGGPLFGGGAKP
jgi:hypothetical protein